MQFLDNSLHFFRFWLASSRASIVREMEFRTNFILGIVRQVCWFVIFVFYVSIIFLQTPHLAGWSQQQVLVLFALSRLIEGLINLTFANNMMMFPRMVQTGEFDFTLLRPLPPQLFTAFRFMRYQNLGNCLAGLFLLIYAMHLPNAPAVSWLEWLAFIVLLMAGIAIYYTLLILVASLVFVLERLESLWGFNELFSEPLTVPFDIFPRTPRLLLTYLLPLAFVVFVPAQALTDRLTPWQVPAAIALAVILMLLATIAWRAGLRRYSSASS